MRCYETLQPTHTDCNTIAWSYSVSLSIFNLMYHINPSLPVLDKLHLWFLDVWMIKGGHYEVNNISNEKCHHHHTDCFVVTGSNWLYINIGSANGLVPNRRQVIIWTNADPIHWHIYAALGWVELISLSMDQYLGNLYDDTFKIISLIDKIWIVMLYSESPHLVSLTINPLR